MTARPTPRLVLLQTRGAPDDASTAIARQIAEVAPPGAVTCRVIDAEQDFFQVLAAALDVTVEDRTPLGALAAWARELTGPVWVAVSDYQHVSTVATDLQLAWLLTQSEFLHVVVASTFFAALDGPAVAPRLLTEKVTLHGGSSPDLSRLTDFEREVAAALTVTAGMTLPAVAGVLSADPQLAATALRALERGGLVVRDWTSHPTVYSVTPEFEGVLAEEGQRRWGTEERQALNVRHAQLLAPEDPPKAIRLLLAAGQLQQVEQALSEYYTPRIYADPRIRRHVLDLPPEKLEGMPALLAGRLNSLRADHGSSPEDLREAAQTLRNTSRRALAENAAAGPVALCTLMIAERALGNLEEASSAARELEVALFSGQAPGGTSKWSLHPLFQREIARTGLLAGDLPLAERAARNCVREAERRAQPEVDAAAHAILAIASTFNLRPDEAEYYAGQARLAASKTGILNPHAAAVVAAAEMFAGSAQTEPNTVGGEPEWAAAQPHRIEEWPLLVIAESAQNRRQFGPVAALQTMQKRLSNTQAINHVGAYGRALLLARMGDLATYSGHYATARQALDAESTDHHFSATTRARLALFEKSPLSALELAWHEESEGTKPGNPQNQVIAALAHAQLGDKSAGAALLGSATADLTGPEIRAHFAGLPYSQVRHLAHELPDGTRDRLLTCLDQLPPTHRAESMETLSDAERRVLDSLPGRKSIPKIAIELDLSTNTAKSHLRSIYQKWGVASREEALDRAKQLGLLT